jgi:hypothetical protein
VYAGWSAAPVADLPYAELAEDWRERAERRTLEVVEKIRAGRVEVAPADTDDCAFCDYRDVCRVELRQAAEEAEGAS